MRRQGNWDDLALIGPPGAKPWEPSEDDLRHVRSLLEREELSPAAARQAMRVAMGRQGRRLRRGARRCSIERFGIRPTLGRLTHPRHAIND